VSTRQRVVIPYAPRRWAKPLHATWLRFIALVIHRRAGKTTAVLNHHIRAAMSDSWERRRLLTLRPDLTEPELKELINPPGGRHYGHIMPTRAQAKKVAWDKLKYYTKAIPGARPNESDLLIRFPTGHKVQLFGANDPDSIRGLMASGVSFDEYDQQPANIFGEIVSKALADHLGYAIFLGTIKGRNHLWRTHESARASRDWLAIWQDIDRSLATESGGTIKMLQQAMADELKQVADGIITQDEYDQEWYLSADAAIKGAFYAKELAACKASGRIGRVPYDPMLPVETWWDLGMDDSMSVWFVQPERTGALRVIDYYEHSGEGIPHFAQVLRDRKYAYSKHLAPHDIAVRELGTGKSRKEVAKTHGINFEQGPNLDLADGIHAVRLLLSRCYFDAEKCSVGLNALRNYRKKFNAAMNEFTATPMHDQYSHGADAFRTGAVGHSGPMLEQRKARRQAMGTSGGDSGSGWMRG
jgi:phage terminase large subunit